MHLHLLQLTVLNSFISSNVIRRATSCWLGAITQKVKQPWKMVIWVRARARTLECGSVYLYLHNAYKKSTIMLHTAIILLRESLLNAWDNIVLSTIDQIFHVFRRGEGVLITAALKHSVYRIFWCRPHCQDAGSKSLYRLRERPFSFNLNLSRIS